MIKTFLKTYGTRLIVPLYMIFYLTAFGFLEDRGMYRMNVIHLSIDYSIPFCEYFIVPYILWFFFISFAVFWFMFINKNEKEYLQLILNLMIGMTIFLFISWIYPNGHLLRPMIFPRDNVFTDLVRMLYKVDTSTNILPSIHAYNSVAVCIAIMRCQALKKRSVIKSGTVVITMLIVLATLFLKQHTIIDVILALVFNFIFYVVIYAIDDHRVLMKNQVTARSGHI